jgi:hypothetical protein
VVLELLQLLRTKGVATNVTTAVASTTEHTSKRTKSIAASSTSASFSSGILAQ